MLPEYKHKTNVGVGIGLLVQIIGRILMVNSNPSLAALGLVVAVVGFGFVIWGCAQYAKAKGHSPWFGLLGLLSIVGLIVLFFLPDRHKAANA